MIRWSCLLSFFLLFMFSIKVVVANEECQYKRSAGTYTNFSMHPDTGDLLGIEMTIIWSRNSYYVLFQSSEGEPSIPVLTKANIENGNIYFVLPPESPYRKFKGLISPCAIKGSFSSGQLSPRGYKEFTLEKKNSYWHR